MNTYIFKGIFSQIPQLFLLQLFLHKTQADAKLIDSSLLNFPSIKVV